MSSAVAKKPLNKRQAEGGEEPPKKKGRGGRKKMTEEDRLADEEKKKMTLSYWDDKPIAEFHKYQASRIAKQIKKLAKEFHELKAKKDYHLNMVQTAEKDDDDDDGEEEEEEEEGSDENDAEGEDADAHSQDVP